MYARDPKLEVTFPHTRLGKEKKSSQVGFAYKFLKEKDL